MSSFLSPEIANSFHSALSSFPIVILVLLCLAELFSIFRADFTEIAFSRRALSILLLVFYLGTFFSGYLAGDAASLSFEVPAEEIEFHHQVGRFGLFMSFGLFALVFATEFAKKAQVKIEMLMRVYLLLLLMLVVFTNWLGGELIFEHGAGVRALL